MIRVGRVLCAALTLAACSFYSDAPLFEDREAAAPFADGAQYLWRENGRQDGEQRVIYRRVGVRYEVSSADAEERPITALFVAIPQTPEEDYIVQVQLEGGEPGRAYVFLWRIEGGYRFISAPGALLAEAEPTLAALCRQRRNDECELASARDAVALYQSAVYSTFVTGGVTPSNFVDQIDVVGDE